jgi:hypothetical protein
MTSAPIIIRRFATFAEAREAAGGLPGGDEQTGPFDRLDWFEALHASAFPHERPFLICAEQGEARCWLALVESGDRLMSLSNWYSFWHRPQFANVQDGIVRGRLLLAIARDLRQDYSRLVLHPVVESGDNVISQLTRSLRLAGWSVIPRVMGYKRIIDLPPGTHFSDYWAARPGTLRSTHARKSQRHPLDISIHDRLTDALWQDFRTVFSASWKPQGDDFAFLRNFAERESDAGRLMLGFAHQDGVPVATEFWTVDNRVAYIHKLAFDERAADFSPGTQLSHALFAHAIDERRVRAIDFGTGDNAYKANWIPTVRPVLELDAFDLRRPETWRSALTTGLSALRPARAKSSAGGSPRRAALARRQAQPGDD